MPICPSCAKERDERDLICPSCGHTRNIVGKPSTDAIAAPATSSSVSAIVPTALAAEPKRVSRIGVLAAAAVGAVVTATFIVRSSVLGSRTTAPAATIAPAQPAATPVVASRPPAVAWSETTGEPKWRRTRQSPWATDGSRIIGFEVEAERDVRVYMDRVRPVLAVRCTPRAIEVFVFLGSSPSVENGRDTHAVRIALDHEPDVEQHWLESSDMQALFAPEGKAFAARIATASHLRFAFTPFNAPPTMAEFDVHGFDKPLATMSKTCAAAPRRGPSPRG